MCQGTKSDFSLKILLSSLVIYYILFKYQKGSVRTKENFLRVYSTFQGKKLFQGISEQRRQGYLNNSPQQHVSPVPIICNREFL